MPSAASVVEVFGFFVIVAHRVKPVIADCVGLRAAVDAVPTANLDGRWIAFAKLEFRFRCPRAKHAWREVIASFFVVIGQELLDFFNTAIVDVLAHDIPLYNDG